jgi:hypothetical protein
MDDKRRCASCSKRAGWPVYKPLSEFWKRTVQGGYDSYCKACRKRLNAEYIRPRRPRALVTIASSIPPRPDRVYRGPTGPALKTVQITGLIEE